MNLYSIMNRLHLELNKFKCNNCPLHTICDSMENHSICGLVSDAETTCKIRVGDKVKIVNILEFILEHNIDILDLETQYDVKKEDILLLSESEVEVISIKRKYYGEYYTIRLVDDKYIDIHGDLIFTITEHGACDLHLF